MNITKRFVKRISCSIGLLVLLAPLTGLAQTKVVVIPLFGDDAKPLKNIITVAKANGMFTDPVAAVNSIKDASADNPYLVVIGPGVYTITQTLQMKPYVNIVGSGEIVTKITGAISTDNSDESSAIISGVNYSALSSLTVENSGGGVYSIGLYNNGTDPRVSHVTVKASGGGFSNFGVYNCWYSSPTMNNVTVTASGGSNSGGVYNHWHSSPTMNNVTVTASGANFNTGVHSYYSSPTMKNVTITASGGSQNCGVDNGDSSSTTMNNVTVTVSGGTSSNRGVENYSSLTMNNVTVTASGGSGSIGVLDDGSSSEIRRSTVKGGSSSLSSQGGTTATVSQSTLIGYVAGGTSNKCVACDDGSGKALDENCK
jgi:hypothetical protein